MMKILFKLYVNLVVERKGNVTIIFIIIYWNDFILFLSNNGLQTPKQETILVFVKKKKETMLVE